MERFDLANEFMEKMGRSDETAKHASAAGRWRMEKDMMVTGSFENSPILRAVKQSIGRLLHGRLSRQCSCDGRPCACGGLAVSLARAEAGTPNNPSAMYAPGRYIRGC